MTVTNPLPPLAQKLRQMSYKNIVVYITKENRTLRLRFLDSLKQGGKAIVPGPLLRVNNTYYVYRAISVQSHNFPNLRISAQPS